MTNAEVSAQFEIVHPRLENLTSYVGASSLLHIPTRRAPAGFPQLVAASRTPQKYDAATRAAVQAMRRKGQRLITIAARFGMSISTASYMTRGRRR